MIEVLFFRSLKRFADLNSDFLLSVAWLEPGLQYHGAVDLARNVRNMSRAFSYPVQATELAVPDRICTQSTNPWIFSIFSAKVCEKSLSSASHKYCFLTYLC